MDKLKIMNTIGDGSCLFHSVLQAISKKYNKSPSHVKKDMVRKLRSEMARLLKVVNPKTGKTNYHSLSRGELEEYSKEIKKNSLENMSRLLDSNSWGDDGYIEYLSNLLNVDIIILYRNNKIYYIDKELNIKNRDTIFIYYHEDVHFSTMYLDNGKEKITFFDKNHPFVVEVKKLI